MQAWNEACRLSDFNTVVSETVLHTASVLLKEVDNSEA